MNIFWEILFNILTSLNDKIKILKIFQPIYNGFIIYIIMNMDLHFGFNNPS